jgi:hypothetical protein
MNKPRYDLRYWDRTRGLRCRAQVRNARWRTFKRIALLVLSLALFTAASAALVGWKKHSAAQRALSDQKVETSRYTALLASVMNGAPLYDRASGTAYFFDKPTAVKLGD